MTNAAENADVNADVNAAENVEVNAENDENAQADPTATPTASGAGVTLRLGRAEVRRRWEAAVAEAAFWKRLLDACDQ